MKTSDNDVIRRFNTLMSVGRKKSFQYVKIMLPLFCAVIKKSVGHAPLAFNPKNANAWGTLTTEGISSFSLPVANDLY